MQFIQVTDTQGRRINVRADDIQTVGPLGQAKGAQIALRFGEKVMTRTSVGDVMKKLNGSPSA